MLRQKTACVTGATRGIGLAVARALAESGYAVIGVGRRQKAEAGRIIRGLPGGGHVYVSADIATGSGRRKIFRALARAGRIDALVNNAGVAPLVRKDILETDEAGYDRVMTTNLKGPFFLTQWVARRMLGQARSAASSPVIVNISSVSAYASSSNRPEYCLSKAGLSMMTTLYADRLAGAGILVYEIRPGIVDTDMTAPVKGKYDRLIDKEGLLPLGRWGKPEDVAAAVRAIVTGAFPYSTGQVFDVDGGFHIRRL